MAKVKRRQSERGILTKEKRSLTLYLETKNKIKTHELKQVSQLNSVLKMNYERKFELVEKYTCGYYSYRLIMTVQLGYSVIIRSE